MPSPFFCTPDACNGIGAFDTNLNLQTIVLPVRLKALEAAGGTIVQEINDVANGLLVASVKDPAGTIVGLRQFPNG